jgi:hypothetical protein
MIELRKYKRVASSPQLLLTNEYTRFGSFLGFACFLFAYVLHRYDAEDPMTLEEILVQFPVGHAAHRFHSPIASDEGLYCSQGWRKEAPADLVSFDVLESRSQGFELNRLRLPCQLFAFSLLAVLSQAISFHRCALRGLWQSAVCRAAVSR